MSDSTQNAQRVRIAFIGALVALLAVTAGVCAGAYRVYQQGALSAVLGGNGRRAMLLATPTPPPTEAPPTEAPTPEPGALADPTAEPLPEESATPEASETPSRVPTPAPTATDTPTPDPLAGSYSVEYAGCITPGGSTVKGRVFDRDGQIVVGARVYVSLDDWLYDVPGATNDSGWYEFYLTNGQTVQIERLVIDGRDQPLAVEGEAAEGVPVRPDCFQELNLQGH
ncbi:MAG: hypothetical protein GX649_03400 [Chloroflexi bacterium]|nr:hypothetical protein [Chloroflexota bacterium]